VPAPRLATYLQMEMLALKQAGALRLPPGVATVYTDWGTAFAIQGIENATAGDGFYAHLQAMYGWPLGGTSAQLTEWVTLSVAFANMFLMWARNATALAMINVSDLRQVPLTAEGVFRYLWSPAAFNATAGGCASQPSGALWPMPAALDPDSGAVACALTASPRAAQELFVADFARRRLGAGAGGSDAVAAAAADVYARYFNLSYMRVEFPRGDHFFGTTLRGLLGPLQAAAAARRFDPALAAAAQPLLGFAAANLGDLDALFNGAVLPLQARIAAAPGGGAAGAAGFFAAHAVAQTAIHFFHTAALGALGRAAVAWAGGDAPGAGANASQALAALDACLDYLRLGEGGGVWRGMYAAESWTWVVGSRAQLAQLVATVAGSGHAAPPADVYADSAIMAYECGGRGGRTAAGCAGFPLAAFNASVAWDVLVRITCAADAPPPQAGAPPAPAPAQPPRGLAGDGCTTTVMGATFTGPAAQIALFAPVGAARAAAGGVSAVTVRYTTDGGAVDGASPAYAGPFAVAGDATTVRARAFDAQGAPLAAENAATVTRAG